MKNKNTNKNLVQLKFTFKIWPNVFQNYTMLFSLINIGLVA